MKNIVRIILPLFIFAMMVSCESVESIFDVEFETTLSGDLNIQVEEPAGMKAAEGIPFSASDTLNPADDEEIEKYMEKIVSIEADSIVAVVDWVSKEGVVFLPGTTVTISDGNTEVGWTIMNDWSINKDDVVKLENVENLYNAVSDILDRMVEFTVSITGECNQSGVSILIRIEIGTTVKANPL